FAISGYAVAFGLDGSLAAPAGSIPSISSHPAIPGETMQILATGLGPVKPPAVTGNNSLDMIRRTLATPSVLIGGLAATVTSAGPGGLLADNQFPLVGRNDLFRESKGGTFDKSTYPSEV